MTNPKLVPQLEALMSSMCFDAIDMAGQHCNPLPAEASCSHYHGIRFLLHQLGARTTLPCQYETFYIDLYKMFKDAHPANEALRVLISGTADFVIPALVSTALKDAGIAAKITIVDRCQTPLELCRVAAEQFEFNWQYLQSDILDLHFDEPFGLIVTDRLLGHIPNEVRTPVLDKLGSLLSPIGRFVTMVSIRPSGRPSSKDANALIRRLNENKEKCREQGQYSLSELTRMVKSYANSHSTYAIRNCDSLEKVFEYSAMVIRAISHVETDPRLIRGKDPVSLVKLVAQRR